MHLHLNNCHEVSNNNQSEYCVFSTLGSCFPGEGDSSYHDFIPSQNFPENNRKNNNELLKISPHSSQPPRENPVRGFLVQWRVLNTVGGTS